MAKIKSELYCNQPWIKVSFILLIFMGFVVYFFFEGGKVAAALIELEIAGVIVSIGESNRGVYPIMVKSGSRYDEVFVIGERHLSECHIAIGDSIRKNKVSSIMNIMHVEGDKIVCTTKYVIN